MKPAQLLAHPHLHLSPALELAIARTLDAWLPAYRHLPVPVRFRASGALHAWQRHLEEGGETRIARHALSNALVPVMDAQRCLRVAITPQVHIHPGAVQALSPMFGALMRFSSELLCFWLRDGALYEPTLPLGTLLGGSDIAQDLPMQLVRLPCASLCLVPPWQQRHHCAGASAIFVFEHAAGAEQAPARRTLTVLACWPSADGIRTDECVIAVHDESESLNDALARVTAATTTRLQTAGFSDARSLQEAQAQWQQMLDYTVKVLLYLGLDASAVRALRPYTAAPRVFPGLGRRKRDAKLAEVEQLYDRYIVGPEFLQELGVAAGSDASSKGHELSAHWRRGHFRSQPYGPQASLRKVAFIAPTVVRADRLPAGAG